jgi:hypothetical protein
MRGFVKDYTVWIHHDETVVHVDQQEDEAEIRDYLDQYIAYLDAEEMNDDGHEQGGDAGGWDGNDEGGAANNDGRGCVGDEDDLEEIIQAIGPNILLKSPKGLENYEIVKKASKETIWC